MTVGALAHAEMEAERALGQREWAAAREALTEVVALLGDREDEIATSRRALLALSRWRSESDVDALEELVAWAEQPWRANPRSVSMARSAAWGLAEMGAHGRARALLHLAHERSLLCAGPRSPMTLAILSELSKAYERTDEGQATHLHQRLVRDGSGVVDVENSRRWLRQHGLALPEPTQDPVEDSRQVRAARRRLTAVVHEDDQVARLGALTEVGDALDASGAADEALAVFTEIMDRGVSLDSAETTLAAANRAGVIAERHGADVREPWERMVARAEEELGSAHQVTLVLRHNLADTFMALGDIDSACWHWGHVLLALSGDVPDSLPALETARHLTMAHLAAGRARAAARLVTRAVGLARHSLTPGDEALLWLEASLALTYEALGLADESLGRMEEVVAQAELSLGQHHLSTMLFRDNLTVMYLRRRRRDEAEQLWRTTRESIAQGRGQIPAEGDLHATLAHEWMEAGRVDLALATWDEVLAAHPTPQRVYEWAQVAASDPDFSESTLRDAIPEGTPLDVDRLAAFLQVEGYVGEALQVRQKYHRPLATDNLAEFTLAQELVTAVAQLRPTEDGMPDVEAIEALLVEAGAALGGGHPLMVNAAVSQIRILAAVDPEGAREVLAAVIDQMQCDETLTLPSVEPLIEASLQLEIERGDDETLEEMLTVWQDILPPRSPLRTPVLIVDIHRLIRQGQGSKALTKVLVMGPKSDRVMAEHARVRRAAHRLAGRDDGGRAARIE